MVPLWAIGSQYHIQFSSVTQLCPTLCNLMDCSMPGFPVHHQLPELTQNSWPSSWWCHPTSSSSDIPFFSCLQSCPASGSFPMSQFFASGGPSIGASASVLPRNIQDWNDPQILLPLNRMKVKASILRRSAFFIVQLSPPCLTPVTWDDVYLWL